MKKIFIICLIAILSILACSLTNILISSINDKESGRFWNTKKVSRTESCRVREESLSIDNIEDLEMNFSSSDVRLIISDDSQIKIVQYSNSKENGRRLNIDKTNTRIILEEERKFYLFAVFPTDIYDIYIPKAYTNNLKLEAASSTIEADNDIALKNMDITLASGDIKFRDSLKIENLKIFTASGDINIDKLEGKEYDINTTSGDTTITNLNCEKGKMKSISGDIKVGNINTNDVEIETTSGEIEIENIQGKANVKTISGEIEINDIQGTIQGKSTSGDIKLNRFLINSESEISSVSGDIEIYLDKTSNCSIDTKTTSGDVSLPNGRNVVGAEPYNILSLVTTSGDIKLKEI